MNLDEMNEIAERGKGLKLDECRFLSETANEIKPKIVVEIGASKGTSSMILGSVVRETEGHLYCIDPYINKAGDGRTIKKVWEQNVKDLGLTKYITLIEEFSPWVSLEEFKQPIDYLFIDGNHKTRWIIVDYHFWERFLRIGGRVAFHDWRPETEEGISVQRAVDIILEDDKEKLTEIARLESGNGMIAFEKVK